MEKQGVSLVFSLFSSLFTPLKRFRGFLLVVCEENVLFLLSVVCGFLLRVWRSKAFCFLLVLCGFEPGLEPSFKPGFKPGFESDLNPGCTPA